MGTRDSGKHRKLETTNFGSARKQELDSWASFGLEIVLYAIKDWKQLDAGAAQNGSRNYAELRNFFLSDWCDLLLANTNVTGQEILDRLEGGD